MQRIHFDLEEQESTAIIIIIIIIIISIMIMIDIHCCCCPFSLMLLVSCLSIWVAHLCVQCFLFFFSFISMMHIYSGSNHQPTLSIGKKTRKNIGEYDAQGKNREKFLKHSLNKPEKQKISSTLDHWVSLLNVLFSFFIKFELDKMK